MAIDLYRYGSTAPICFKVTLNGVGVDVTLAAADVRLKTYDGVAWSTVANVGTACTAVDSTQCPGLQQWIPAAGSNTQAELIILNIKDNDGGGAFDENCLIIATGGDASARFDAT